MKRKAFTLVELLVVISIIAVLLAVLIPSLSKAKKIAQAVVCKSNLHSISLILSLYAQDNRNRLTPDWWSREVIEADPLYMPTENENSYSKVMWHYCAKNYWQNPKVLMCPSASKVATVDGKTPDPLANDRTCGFPEWGHTEWGWYTPWAPKLKATGQPAMSSYGVNDWAATPYRLDTARQNIANQKAWGTINQKNSSNIPMAFDSAWYSITPEDTTGLIAPNVSVHGNVCKYHSPWTFGPATLPRHNDGVNMVFLDGNVRRVGIVELWSLKWHKTFNTQNTWAQGRERWPDWIKKLRK
jgi:prepilin-type N-terminal cleavage/methylation domain-containing protein/prepilin-type processing-associated H-X9-DG protein